LKDWYARMCTYTKYRIPKEKLYFLSGPRGALPPPPFSGNRIPIM
jgi:hypothetical protein